MTIALSHGSTMFFVRFCWIIISIWRHSSEKCQDIFPRKRSKQQQERSPEDALSIHCPLQQRPLLAQSRQFQPRPLLPQSWRCLLHRPSSQLQFHMHPKSWRRLLLRPGQLWPHLLLRPGWLQLWPRLPPVCLSCLFHLSKVCLSGLTRRLLKVPTNLPGQQQLLRTPR